MAPSLVVLGNLLVDDIVFPDGRTCMAQPGGAVLYGALGAALWGTRVGCVSLVGTDYPAATLDALLHRRIDLGGLHRLDGPGVRTWLLYEGPIRRLIHRQGCPTHEEVSPVAEHIPPDWHAAPAFHLAPMPFAAQRRLLASLAQVPSRFVAVDPHLPVTAETLADWREALADADAFFPGEDELLLEGVDADPRRALRGLATGRLRFIMLKHGARGGMLYDAHEDRLHEWPARATNVVDPTGAGDAFAAGFVSAYLEGRPVSGCLERAAVSASFAIESVGAAALFDATRADAEARLGEWSAAGPSR